MSLGAARERLRAVEPSGSSAGLLWPVNSHIHLPPNFSAFASVEEALDQAAEEEIKLLGASNYYDYCVYGPFIDGALDRGIYPLLGLEVVLMNEPLRTQGIKVNDPGNPGKTYLCGKGVTGVLDPSPRARELLDRVRNTDAERMADMADELDAAFLRHGAVDGYWDAGRIQQVLAVRYGCGPEHVHLQERHLALAYQEAFFESICLKDRRAVLAKVLNTGAECAMDDPVGVQNAIRTHLLKAGQPAYVEESYLSLDEGLELIAELGGIACYPVLADGTKPVSEFEQDPDQLVSNLREVGIQFAEFIPDRNSPDCLEEYATSLRDKGIVVSAGTEHNTLETLDLEPRCRNGLPIPEGVQALFIEGASVLAAIQQRSLAGSSVIGSFDIETLAEEGSRCLGL